MEFNKSPRNEAPLLLWRQIIARTYPAFVNDEELSRFKLTVTSTMASEATAVLLDPEVSAAQYKQDSIENSPVRPRRSASTSNGLLLGENSYNLFTEFIGKSQSVV